jgi:hypothetical protein
MSRDVGQASSSDVEKAIQDCQECHDICLRTTTYGLQKGGQHAAVGLVTLLLDCAEICQTSADFMLRGSQFQQHTCVLCADTCDACAQACERFANDPMMLACAATCRRCAESCRRMAQMTRVA